MSFPLLSHISYSPANQSFFWGGEVPLPACHRDLKACTVACPEDEAAEHRGNHIIGCTFISSFLSGRSVSAVGDRDCSYHKTINSGVP